MPKGILERLVFRLVGWLALVVGGGCGAAIEGTPRQTPYIIQGNGLSLNGLVTNGLRTNGLRMNGLRMNGLRMNGLRMNGFSINDLSATDSAAVMGYIVGCALDPTQTLTLVDTSAGQTYSWTGALGLAPAWVDAPLDLGGQARVSACLLALTNPRAHVMVSLRGPYPSLATTSTERNRYSQSEAAFFGNLFAQPAVLLGCYDPIDPILPSQRPCGVVGSPNVCGIDITSDCPSTCSTRENPDGFYGACNGFNDVITTYIVPPIIWGA
jgi:hypothetical protein